MKVFVNSLLILIIIIALNSCGDSLGINDSDYIKSQVSDTIRIDTMINFKKITIEKIITKTDTVIRYITTNQEYKPVHAINPEIDITENFWNRNDSNITQKILPKQIIIPVFFDPFLDYNPLLPELNLHLDMKFKLIEEQDIFKSREEVPSLLIIDLKAFPVFGSYPLEFGNNINPGMIKVQLEMFNKNGKTRKISSEKINGQIFIESHLINQGQIQGLKLSGKIFTIPKESQSKEQYSISFMSFLIFPEI